MIRIASVALPKSPTNLAQGDEVPQIITRITRQRPSEILHLLQNDFCNTIERKPEMGNYAANWRDPEATLHPFNQPRALAMRFSSAPLVPRWPLVISFYATRFMPGGCHVPSPGGKIEGA